MNPDDSEPRYVISVASRIVGVPTYTLRYYEKMGIMQPSRSQGNIRLYSEREIVQLRRVKTLMDDLGVNLAGVEVVLRMSQRMTKLQHRMEELEAEIQRLKQAGL